MKLDAYLQEVEPAIALAKKIGVAAPLISQWRTGARRVPADRCPEVERATDGRVRCEDLRPDVDWGYLRQSANQKAA